ncbi:MAG: hypothetical protein J3K34DRAFT_521280 [Monoraphidium minutum]|nr:MAG: hypothetical protein J3K34DRAFT_521280 [Monoraphidium minutum]
MASRAVFCVACAILFASCSAYPALWAGEVGTKCGAHPTGQEQLHGSPVPDPKTTFVFRTEKGVAIKTLCPGQTYSVGVAFPEARLSLTTANMGVLEPMTGEGVDNSCPGRIVVHESKLAAVNSFTWDIPCFPSTESAVLQVTSAAGERFAFQTAAAAMPIDTKCAAAACHSASNQQPAAPAAADERNGAAGAAAGAAAMALAGLAAALVV